MEDYEQFLKNVQPGYILYRSINNGEGQGFLANMFSCVFYHIGVVIDIKERTTRGIIVFHYTVDDKGYRLMRQSLDEFLGGSNKFTYVIKNVDSKSLLEKAYYMENNYPYYESYSPFNNCEDFVSELFTGVKRSPQREAGLLVIATAAVILGLSIDTFSK